MPRARTTTKRTTKRKPKAQPTQLLVSTDVFAASSDKSKDLPERILVVPWGTSKTRVGDVICNAETLAVLSANNKRIKRDEVALDFQHNSVKPSAADEPIKVAGYGTPEVIEGEGVYLSAIRYTDEGETALRAGHYPDISPAVLRNAKGEVILLHSVGAVRHGEIDGLTLFSADETQALLDSLAVSDGDPDSDEANLDLREIVINLINAMGANPSLSEEAADGEIGLAAKSILNKKQKTKESPTEIDTMEAKVITQRLDALEANQQSDKREALIARATREGKVIPLSADEIAKLDIDILSAMIDKLPETVPLDSRVDGSIDNFAASGAHHTDEDKHVADLLGVDLSEKPDEKKS